LHVWIGGRLTRLRVGVRRRLTSHTRVVLVGARGVERDVYVDIAGVSGRIRRGRRRRSAAESVVQRGVESIGDEVVDPIGQRGVDRRVRRVRRVRIVADGAVEVSPAGPPASPRF